MSVFVVFISAGTAWGSAKVAIETMSLTQTRDGARIVFTLDGAPDYRAFVVEGPPRIVVDFEARNLTFDAPPEPRTPIGEIRFGQLESDRARIVVDLDQGFVLERDFYLPPLAGRAARLVLDLKRATSAPSQRESAAGAAADIELPQQAIPAERVVVLDPGHGGIDPGAVAEDDLYEKNVVLDFALRVASVLEGTPGLSVYLTRTTDEFLTFTRRLKIARAYGADLFISIHADAAPQDFVHGATVYTVSERPSDATAAALAARENLADTVSGEIEPELQEDVGGILADLMREETKLFAHEFAEELISEMRTAVRLNSNPHRQARFRVLQAHDIPSVLLELGYLTNKQDTESLLQEEWQQRAAKAVADAIKDFLLNSEAGVGRAQLD